jgi:hypothetical protein
VFSGKKKPCHCRQNLLCYTYSKPCAAHPA